MFQVGDAVVHPVRGAGIVTDIGERERRGRDKLYYRIELVGRPRTHLMVPVDSAEGRGVRQAISECKLKKVWQMLNVPAQPLPSGHRDRRELLEDRLYGGDALEVAEALRDLAWRRKREGQLSVLERRLYRKGVRLLAGEIAAVRGIDLLEARLRVWEKVRKGLIEH
jgi:RNA polymerase-interacting CarD/CdnL/TRCF family regulator